VDSILRGIIYFNILEGHHLMAMGINVEISMDLKYLCLSHTKICKPHLLT
jgi:hypothetical protein